MFRKASMKFAGRLCFSFPLMVILLGACQEKSGLLPPITTPPYVAPTDLEAKKAYLYGFEGRYNRPEIDYPAEIKARVAAARLKKLKRSEKLMRANIRLARKAVNSGKLGELTGPDKEYADVIRGFGKDSEITDKHLKQIDDGKFQTLLMGD